MTGESPGSGQHLGRSRAGVAAPAGGEAGDGRVSLPRALEGTGRRWPELSLLPRSVLGLCCPELPKEALQ